MGFKEEIKRTNALAQIKRYCKRCGHSQYIPKFITHNHCTYCGYPIYRDNKTEFQLELEKRLANAN